MDVIPVILAGGAGTRLWPLSNEQKPKQFHNITGEGTLLELTINRLKPLHPDFCLIVTARMYEDMSYEQLHKTGLKGSIISEPMPRNTAPAILYAATYLSKLYEDAIMLVLPADHYIKKTDLFIQVLQKAIQQANNNYLVTIGITPTYPETGYGYIKAYDDPSEVKPVEMFVEKPNLDTAKKYLREGNYFWNSGIFVWKISVILDYYQKLMPQLYNAFQPLRDLTVEQLTQNDDLPWEIKRTIFSEIESISIDYGIMEKAYYRFVIPGEFGCADLGSWASIDDILNPDSDMNRSSNSKQVIFHLSKNCTVFPDKKLIAVVGLNDAVVVDSGDEILVMDKNASQNLREVVNHIKNKPQ